MRKILISILIVLLLVVSYIVLFEGLNVLGLEVLSIFQIDSHNKELDVELQKVSTLTSVDQPNAMSVLEESAKQLLIAKEEYNDKVLYSSTESIEAASKTRPYKTEYLWVVLGNHAKKNGINLRYELRPTITGTTGLYDINFTVTGSYVSISEFITSLENDSSLNFKIEAFKLVPFNNNTKSTNQANDVLQATFIVRDVNVEVDQTTSQITETTAPITNQEGVDTSNNTNLNN